jgi:hypothetical protein
MPGFEPACVKINQNTNRKSGDPRYGRGKSGLTAEPGQECRTQNGIVRLCLTISDYPVKDQ